MDEDWADWERMARREASAADGSVPVVIVRELS